MTFTSVMLTILWLLVIPMAIGGIFAFRDKGFIAEGCIHENKGRRQVGLFMWSWFFGQLLLWCVFQLIAVWMILHNGSFSAIVKYYLIFVIGMCVVSIVINTIRQLTKHSVTNLILGKGKRDNNDEHINEQNYDKFLSVVWIVFAVILVVQMILQVKLAYMDADDAYYVSEAVTIESSDKMYYSIPYTGQTTEMDYRHSLEPFPVWLAFLSRITGTKVVTMAHVLLPVIILPLTYGVYALVGNRVLGKEREKLPIYLVVTELLVMFSLYSAKIPEKFFITRIRQGKSTLSSLIIPGIILCLFLILSYAKEKKKTDIAVWIMLFMLNTAGCLCSTLGALLCVVPIAIVAVMMIFAYRKGWHIIPMVIGCLPCFVFAMLYLLNR